MSSHPVSAPDLPAINAHDRPRRVDWHRYAPEIVVVMVSVLLLLVGGLTTPAFLNVTNLLVIVRAASYTGIAALGLTFVTASGNFFSLSIEQTAALCAIAFAGLLTMGLGVPLAIIGVLLIALVLGLAQGAVVSLGLNPIVATLGFGALISGFSSLITNNRLVRITTTDADFLGSGRPLGIPTQSWAFLILIVLAWVVFRKARIGRITTLVGANRHAAQASGIVLAQARMVAFTLSSLAAGVVGLFTAAQIGQGNVTQFTGFNIDVIAAVLVGGTAVQGGQGSPLRSAFGALFIATLTNFMLINNYPFGVRVGIEGVAVVGAASVFHVLRSRRG
jgi:ribose transport system permease protein